MSRHHWNYRIVRYPDDDCVGLHEVHYTEPLLSMTESAVGFVGCSRWSIAWQMLGAMWSALRRPALDYVDDAEPRYTLTPKGLAVLEGK